ncbi:MAG: hypothetical protein ABII71_05855 [Candidatus Micrarchaeota archaeon]
MAKGRRRIAKSDSSPADSMRIKMGELKIMRNPHQATETKMYPQDRLKHLVADLRSGEPRREVEASVEFITNYDAITIAINATPDLTKTEVLEKVIEDIIKDRQMFFEKLVGEGRKKELDFLAKSKAIPIEIQEQAKTLLTNMDANFAAQQGKAKEAKGASVERSISIQPVSAIELHGLLLAVKAPATAKAVKATIEFLSNYQGYANAVNNTPNLTVTEVNKAVAEVLKRRGPIVIQQLEMAQNVTALSFLSSFFAAPIEVREKAKLIVQKIEGAKKHREVSEVVAIPVKVQEYSSKEAQDLFGRLGNKQGIVAVAAAIEFISNYDLVAEALMKTPMLNVTDMTKKALNVITAKSEMVFSTLESTKNLAALKFVATSSNIPKAISEQAQALFRKLAPKEGEKHKEEKKKKALDRIVIRGTPGGEGGEEEQEEESKDGEEEEKEEERGDWTKFK